MIINHNIAAMNTHRQLGSNNAAASKNLEKLSSGLKINKAGDDAAGLAISEKMRGQIRGLDMAQKNSQDAISLIQTAEGALNETHDILQRMRELATQASNDTNVGVDRAEIQKEMNQLTSEINRVGNTTEFNTQSLLKGDGKSNLALTGVGTVAGSMGSGTAGSTTHTQATQSLTAATGATGATLDGKSVSVTLNGQELKVKFVQDTGLTGTDNIAVDTDNVTSNEVTIRVKGAITAGGTNSNQALASAMRDGLTAVIGNNDNLKGNFAITGATDQVIITATTTANGGKADGAQGNIATTAASAGVITGGAAASVGTTSHVAATKNIDFNGKTGADLIGKGFSIDGKQYEFYDANKGAYKGTAEAINISETSTAAQIATAVASQVKGEGFTAAATTTTVTFSATKLGAEGNNSVKFTDGGVQKNFEASFQVGANKGQSMSIEIADMRSAALGITGKAGAEGFTATNSVNDGTSKTGKEAALDVSTHEKASSSIQKINDAIEQVSAQRSNLGAFQNRLEHTINNLGTSSENLTTAESRIRDVDMAKEMMSFTKNNILTQAAQAMLAQAQQSSQGVLQLLR